MWFRSRSLTVHQTRLVVLIALIVGVAISTVQISLDFIRVENNLTRSVEQVVRSVEKAAIKAAFTYDQDLANEVADGLLQFEPIVAVTIADEVDDILVRKERPLDPADKSMLSGLKLLDSRSTKTELYLSTDANRLIGRLLVTVSPEPALRLFVERAVNSLVGGVVSAILMGLILLFVFHRLLTRPLLRMADDFSRVDADNPAGDSLPNPDEYPDNEFRKVIAVGNQLLQAISISMAERNEMTQALHVSERRFRRLFENAEISIWNEDFSGVIARLSELRQNGTNDLRAYLDNEPDVLWRLAGELKVLQINEATLKLFGGADDQAFRENLKRIISPSARELFESALVAIWEGHKVFRQEATFRRFDGTSIDAIVSFRIPATDEGFSSVPVSIIDITDRKHAERRLMEAKEEAIKANKAKSEFLASMSHELRTPLNAVLGFAQMLQYDPQHPLQDNQREHVESIVEGGNHLLELVNEILDLSRIEANQLNLTLEDIDASEVVADCIDLSGPIGEPKSVQIINRFHSDSAVTLRTDRLRLKQCLLNLLSNAVRFNKQGGTVTVDGQRTTDGFLRINVTDTGIGIADRHHGSVFHMFHRLGADPMRSQEGTGIGLSVTKLLVEQMAGRIGFESTENVGSTFWIELPLAKNSDVIIWSDALKIGIDPLDKDHQTLVSLLNAMMRDDVQEAEMGKAIEALLDYTFYHFRREEAVMEECGFPDLANHREIHRKLAARANELASTWQAHKSREHLQALRNLLRSWLFEHIATVDMEIFPYTKGRSEDISTRLKDVV